MDSLERNVGKSADTQFEQQIGGLKAWAQRYGIPENQLGIPMKRSNSPVRRLLQTAVVAGGLFAAGLSNQGAAQTPTTETAEVFDQRKEFKRLLESRKSTFEAVNKIIERRLRTETGYKDREPGIEKELEANKAYVCILDETAKKFDSLDHEQLDKRLGFGMFFDLTINGKGDVPAKRETLVKKMQDLEPGCFENPIS
jgi:hypothetical protein